MTYPLYMNLLCTVLWIKSDIDSHSEFRFQNLTYNQCTVVVAVVVVAVVELIPDVADYLNVAMQGVASGYCVQY